VSYSIPSIAFVYQADLKSRWTGTKIHSFRLQTFRFEQYVESSFEGKFGHYVTGRPNILRPSCREVKNNVWKYLQNIVMGLYAVCERKLAHPDRVLSLKRNRKRRRTKRSRAKSKNFAGRAYDTGHGGSRAISKWKWSKITLHTGSTKISL